MELTSQPPLSQPVPQVLPPVSQPSGSAPISPPLLRSVPRIEYALTDTGNAERFAAQHVQDVRYSYDPPQWYCYKNGCWQPDLTGEVERRTKATARSIYSEAANQADDAKRAEIVRHARRSESEAARVAMLRLARNEPKIAITLDQFDADPDLLNLRNGTIDLRNLRFRAHQREDLLTCMTRIQYNASARCPKWYAALERWFPDPQIRAFMQEVVGVSLSGTIFDEFWLFLYGDGDNGKSTFVRMLEALCGSYGHKARAETFMNAIRDPESNKPAPELLALKGKRLVAVQETSQRHSLNEALIKDLTGRDSITARGMYGKHPVTFVPQLTLWMIGNHRPQIKDTTKGTWRRVRLVPFDCIIPKPERDPLLFTKLERELPGVLNWALEGMRRVLERGIVVPDSVRAATQEYQAEQDTFGAFMSVCTVTGPRCEATAAQLWKEWGEWCIANGERTGSQKVFGGELKRRGFTSTTTRKGILWLGIGMLDTTQEGYQ